MREVRFSFKHHGCWSTDSFEKYPNVRCTLLSSFHQKQGEFEWSFLWRIEAENEGKLDGFLEFLKSHRTITKVEVLSKKKNLAIVHERGTAASSGVYDIMSRSECYVMPDMHVHKGLEWWHVLAESPEDITTLFGELKKIGELYVEKIGRYEFEKRRFELTEKQEKALKLAMKNEYYEWPRKVTLEELSSMVGISRRALQDRLRRAESKVMDQVLEKELEAV